MSRTPTLAAGFLWLGSLIGAVRAADWPQFRGPGGLGLTEASKLPAEWSVDKNIRWKVAVPGTGWSSPVVWGNKVILTTAVTENQTKPMPFNFGGGRPRGERGGGDRPAGNRPPREQPPADDANPAGEKEEGEPPADKGPRRRGGGGGGFGGQAPDAVYRFEVYCFDRDTGAVLWQRLAAEQKPAIPTHSTNTYASETPVTDGERVYAYFGMTGLFCFDLDGNPIWSKDLGAYPMFLGWGTGSSPVLAGGHLILQCDNDKSSFLVALDTKTGEEKWRVRARINRAGRPPAYGTTRCGPSWSSPRRNASSRTIRPTAPCYGNSTASRADARRRPWVMTKRRSSRYRRRHGRERSLGGRAGRAAGKCEIAPGREQPEQIAWKLPRGGPPMASPLVYQGYLYILEERGGLLSCYNATDGTRAYQQRVPGAKGFTASPWANDGKIFCLDAGGQTFVLKAGPEFEVLGENKLDEMCWATPAVADGTVFLRTTDHLWCIKP